jgi:hypothetical protein
VQGEVEEEVVVEVVVKVVLIAAMEHWASPELVIE